MSETLSKVRELLRRDSVKLWLPPYTNEDLSEGEIPYDLVLKYSLETGHSQDEILAMVLELRTVATKRLGENKRFSDTGIAVLNVSCQSENHHQETVLETSLTITGLELKERIADKLQIPVNSMKLVAAGNFLTNSETLEDQAVTHNCQILCILLNPEQVEAEQESDFRQLINRTRAAAVRLAKNTDDNLNPHFLRVEDQYGQPLKIPKEENEALAVAMALHERGRTTLKLRDYACALLFFLEADHEFKQCRSDILKCVDNYAILCLDIVWCYLQLRKVDSLPDAESRLQICEECFRRSYGSKFERLAFLKAGIDLERSLIIRLKLLQGILCFHKRKYADSSNFLDQCEQGIKELEVDDEKLIQVMSMGYGEAESRLGLRASHGNVEVAVQMIVNQREQYENRVKEEREENRKKFLARRLGKTVNGTEMDVKLYEQLVGMGFRKSLVIEALREANNDSSAALTIITALGPSGSIAEQRDSDSSLSGSEETHSEQMELLETLSAQLREMGFDVRKVKKAIKKANFDLDKAIRLLSKDAERSGLTDRSESFDEDEKAFKELESSVSGNLFDHLDTTLEEEKKLCDEYRKLLVIHI